MAEVVLARRARVWLNAQTDYRLIDHPRAAAHLANRMADAIRLLGEFPLSGVRTGILGTRRLIMAPYVFTYREARPGLVVIIDIRHSRQRETPPPDKLE